MAAARARAWLRARRGRAARGGPPRPAARAPVTRTTSPAHWQPEADSVTEPLLPGTPAATQYHASLSDPPYPAIIIGPGHDVTRMIRPLASLAPGSRRCRRRGRRTVRRLGLGSSSQVQCRIRSRRWPRPPQMAAAGGTIMPSPSPSHGHGVGPSRGQAARLVTSRGTD